MTLRIRTSVAHSYIAHPQLGGHSHTVQPHLLAQQQRVAGVVFCSVAVLHAHEVA